VERDSSPAKRPALAQNDRRNALWARCEKELLTSRSQARDGEEGKANEIDRPTAGAEERQVNIRTLKTEGYGTQMHLRAQRLPPGVNAP
jgi:hypothetical protein